jgi:hypothetical protein
MVTSGERISPWFVGLDKRVWEELRQGFKYSTPAGCVPGFCFFGPQLSRLCRNVFAFSIQNFTSGSKLNSTCKLINTRKLNNTRKTKQYSQTNNVRQFYDTCNSTISANETRILY